MPTSSIATTVLPSWVEAYNHKLDDQLLLSLSMGMRDHRDGINGSFDLMIERNPSKDEAENLMQWDSLLKLFSSSAQSRLTTINADSGSKYLTCTASISVLQKLAQSDGIVRIEWGQALVAQRSLPAVLGTNIREIRPLPKSSSKLLMGIIDHGCPFAHLALRKRDAQMPETRILSIWDQARTSNWKVGHSPDGIRYGVQIERQLLNELMVQSRVSGNSVDEMACYEKAGYLDLRYPMTHGTHTLGLLAGSWLSPSLVQGRDLSTHESYEADAASQSDIVFVQLPREVLQAPSHGGDHRCILDGIRYVANCAGDATEHIVIVIDYGSNLGPHDGSSFFEGALKSLINEFKLKGKRLDLVFPSGNSADDKSHASAMLNKDELMASVAWVVPPGVEVPSYMQIWIPGEYARKVNIELTLPNAPSSRTISLNSLELLPDVQNAYLSVVNRQEHNGDLMVSVRLSPNQMATANLNAAPAGRYIWNIQASESLSDSDSIPTSFYASWGGENLGIPKRSSKTKWLSQSGNVRVSKRGQLQVGSLLGSACLNEVTVVGGFENSNADSAWRIAYYSSIGPTRGLSRNGPDFLAMSDDSLLRWGVLGLGSKSGITGRMQGTSVAAPQGARFLANAGQSLHAPNNYRAQGNLTTEQQGSGRRDY
jgi:hypothetical protein